MKTFQIRVLGAVDEPRPLQLCKRLQFVIYFPSLLGWK